ncbi:hypothetical protein JCM5353_005399 [Sporobolomyces roseus]
MKVIALLSGGKDSIYNLHHCILNDHEPVCVASLGPPEGQDEMDSFMYQTVAHSGLATMAQALDLPFFTTSITGKAINQSSEYGSRTTLEREAGTRSIEEERSQSESVEKAEEQDETEDLYRLLRMVQTQMPEVQGVAAGAILSNYQRVRVEHVCSQLGLTPIAYLWERDQKELLGEMVESGQESVLVKVAGAGLGVQHLGKTLGEMQPILHKLNERFETHICGEGGEYETFTLDSPIFKKKLILEETQTIVSNPDPHATVAHLYLSRLSLADKPDHPTNETFEALQERLRRCVAIPKMLNEDAEEVEETVRNVSSGSQEGVSKGLERLSLNQSSGDCDREKFTPSKSTISACDGWLNFSAISAYSGDGGTSSQMMSVEEEVAKCFEYLTVLLQNNSSSLTSLSHLNVLLSASSMSLFPRLNKIYSSYFGTSPPTRACVAIHFSPGDPARVKLDGIARVDGTETRTALHVQSLSYWGAANIGPYSQAITVANRCYLAGQIPLIPASLALPSPAYFPTEVALSLQHVRRIVKAASEGRWQGWMEGGVAWIQEEDDETQWRKRAVAAREGWRTWNQQQIESQDLQPPLLLVSAAQLPRSASIEWQVTWQTGQVPWSSNEDESSSEEDDKPKPTKMRRIETNANELVASSSSDRQVSWQCSRVNGIADTVVGILGCSIDEGKVLAVFDKLGQIHSIKAFYKPDLSMSKGKIPDLISIDDAQC